MKQKTKLSVSRPTNEQREIENFVNPRKIHFKRNRKPISAKISPVTHKALKLYAVQHDMEISEVIEEAVLKFINI